MPKKQIFGSIIILIVLSLICMFIYDEFKDEKNNHQKKLIVEKGGSKLSLYYTDKNHHYYVYGLRKIMVDYGDHDLELDKALEAKQITIDEVIHLIGNDNKLSYGDGGSIKINNQDISLLQCHTTNGNRDYYFGPSNMVKKEGFCQEEAYICTFTKTYLVRDITESNDSKYIYLTLRAFQDEEVFTVKVKKSLNSEIEEGKSYEFTFASIGNSKKEDIESIFTNHKLLSIIATDKEGLEQVNESVCE